MTVFTPEVIAGAVQAAALQPLSQRALVRLASYGNLLIKWNARMNLTAIREPAGILERHLVESIAAAEFVPAQVKTLLDFGSGGGLPGVPIAICREEITVTLAESQSKKAAFLAEVVRTVGGALQVHAGRVEALPVAVRFDVVALRAVDRMPEAVQQARGRINTGGFLMLFVTGGTREVIVSAAEAVSVTERALSPSSSVLLCQV